jgi:hypothetical protein
MFTLLLSFPITFPLSMVPALHLGKFSNFVEEKREKRKRKA